MTVLKGVLNSLVMFCLSVVPAFANQEAIQVQPTSPTTATPVSFLFSGVGSGPVTVDEIVLSRNGNTFAVTVSRRSTPTGSISGYGGSVDAGKLPPGHYTVEFYVRNITILVVNGLEVEG